MQRPSRLVVFDALMLKAYASEDRQTFQWELEAFQILDRRGQFRLLFTRDILSEYQKAADKPPQFQLLPVLNNLAEKRVTLNIDENNLKRFPIALTGFTKWHQTFIKDAIGAEADYFITDYRPWLRLSEQTQEHYGLVIATPEHFVFLEG